jgi:hypothetical protein
METDQDVYALGDVHGDYERLVTLLAAAEVIEGKPDHPREVRWAAGKAVLVCTGDLIDKGKHSLKVLAFFQALQAAAAKAGGRVIVTMGNHEAEFLADPGNPKAQEFVKELADKQIKPAEVAAGRDALGVGIFLRGLPFAARVNDWFFAHAGDTRRHTLKQLRLELEEGVDAHGYKLILLEGKKEDPRLALRALLDARLHPAPWWQEGKDEPDRKGRDRLAGYVQALGVNHLVIGHQPGRVTFADGSRRPQGTMHQHYDGLIFLIDVGMSRGIDDSGQGYSTGALLRIHGGKPKATAIFPDASTKRLWPKP